ncbi:MAG: 50S ribosomal protein L29 [Nitrospirota bacterium]|nr:50S ribosomal protein L29 [Thermodesulfovibrionia bacterium]MDZ4383114.1 50S ribosomal protein L29 [Thermodesulfovibrionia bacterium]
MGKRVAELRPLTVDELREEESRLRKELFNLRFQKSTGEIENPLRIRQVKKDISRVLTLITEKQKGTRREV